MKQKLKQITILILLMLPFHLVQAQEQKSSFSLEEAIQFAMKNSYVLHNTQQDIAIAQKQVWETISTGLPQFMATFDYNKNISAAKSPFPVFLIPRDFWSELGIPEDTPADATFPVSFMQKYNSSYTFKVEQLLFDGSYIVGVGSAQLYLNLSKQAHEKTEIDIRNAVSQAYYMVLISERFKTIAQENLENTQKLYEETKAYYENGFREEQDVAQLKIMLKNAENEILKANREIEISKVVLKYTLGYDMESGIQLNDKLEEFVTPLVEQTNSFQLDLNNHIDYRMAYSNFKVSEKLLKLEQSTYLPTISGYYNFGRTAYADKANLFTEDWYKSSMIGLSASIRIFNSGQKRSKVQQARIKLDKARTDQKLAEETLKKDYLTASAELETAREKYLNDQENKALAKSILDKTQVKFNHGMVSSAELSQQETQYITSFQAAVASTLQLLQAELKLRKAAGAL